MGRYITDEAVLMERVVEMLPKDIPATAVYGVECDPYDGGDGDKPSYWVYLNSGYVCPEMGCHTIHEDNLKNLRSMVKSIEVWADDPSLEIN